MSNHTLGLIVGLFFAFIHAVWSIAVATIPSQVQSFYVWILTLHHISIPFAIITPFNATNAALLILVTFISGYLSGWILAALFNLLHRKSR